MTWRSMGLTYVMTSVSMANVSAVASTEARRRLPAPRIEPTGKWGPWLTTNRISRGRTQQQVYDDLRTRWPDLFPWLSDTSVDSYRAFEKGKPPTPEQEAAFLVYYRGAIPPAEPESPVTSDGAGLSELAEAIKDQAKAITALADQVKALAAAQPDPAAVAALAAKLVTLSISETLPSVLRAAGLPQK